MGAWAQRAGRKAARAPQALLSAAVVLLLSRAGDAQTSGFPCEALDLCSGHGTCNGASGTCTCQNGWGSATDIASYKSPDCRFRVCPAGKAWVDLPTDSTHAHNNLAECSRMGVCDRGTGICQCFPGFEGDACQRSACPNGCSGHGKCMTIKQLQAMPNAALFGHSASSYGGDESSTTFDEDRIYGCVCDSSWTVGYGSGERQTPEYFGADCSLRHCPSGDDPRTKRQSASNTVNHEWLDETNCFLKDNNGTTWRGNLDSNGNPDYSNSTAPSGTFVGGSTPPSGSYVNAGASGNLCHVDCSNRGVCNYESGECQCVSGSYGEACQNLDVRAGGL